MLTSSSSQIALSSKAAMLVSSKLNSVGTVDEKVPASGYAETRRKVKTKG